MDYSKLETIKATIGGNSYNLLVAKSDEEKEYGLMGVKKLDDDEGMIFDYSDDPQEEISFWMKDTVIPLMIIFVNDNYKVEDIKWGEPESEELLTCESKENPIIYVIEVNQNTEIKLRDSVEIENEKFDLPKNKMLVLNSDGSVQFSLEGGERIFSRVSSRVIIRKAKKANISKKDVDYKSLGRYIFSELDRQSDRNPEYVETPNN